MGKRGKDLTPEKKELILQLTAEGKKGPEIGNILGINRFTVCKVLKRLHSQENTEKSIQSKRRSKCGRKRKSTERTNRTLLNVVKTNRRKTLSEISATFNQQTPQKLSKRRVQRRLHEHGYRKRVVKKVTTISARNRLKRRAFSRSHLHWNVQRDWSKVIFSDETQVVLGKNKRVQVWRKNEEKWKPRCLGVYAEKSVPQLSAMFWGCIRYEGVGTLDSIVGNINSQKYIQVLDTNLWPVIAKVPEGRDYIFQEDNAPVHTSRETTQWKTTNNIPTMNWPPQSPDMNIIENVWRTLKLQLQKRVMDIKTQQQLLDSVQEIWQSLTPVYIKSLYDSLPKRMIAVLRANGCITKY